MILIHSTDYDNFNQQSQKYKKLYNKIAKRIQKEKGYIGVYTDNDFTSDQINQLENLLQSKPRTLSIEENKNKQKYEKEKEEYLNKIVDKKEKKKTKKLLKKLDDFEPPPQGKLSTLYGTKKSALEKNFNNKSTIKQRKVVDKLLSSVITKKKKKKLYEDEDEWGDNWLLSDNESGAFLSNLFLHGDNTWTKKAKDNYYKNLYSNEGVAPNEENRGNYITGVELKEVMDDIFSLIDNLTYTPIGKDLIPAQALLNLFMGDERYVKEYIIFRILPEMVNNFGANGIGDLLDYLNLYYEYQKFTNKYQKKKEGSPYELPKTSESEKIVRDLYQKKMDTMRLLQYIQPVLYKN